jgi:hypothetical protein
MISKITAIVAAALVLGSAGVASAQTHRQTGWQTPYAKLHTLPLPGRSSHVGLMHQGIEAVGK